jgi:hypothetical protein
MAIHLREAPVSGEVLLGLGVHHGLAVSALRRRERGLSVVKGRHCVVALHPNANAVRCECGEGCSTGGCAQRGTGVLAGVSIWGELINVASEEVSLGSLSSRIHVLVILAVGLMGFQ